MRKNGMYLFIFLIISINMYAVTSNGTGPKNINEKEAEEKNEDNVRISILFDNYVIKEGTEAGWGFSCLVEGTEKTILFDTGANGEILLSNIDNMNVDITKTDLLVLSHNHYDHTGGIESVLSRNSNIPAFIPVSFPKDFSETTGIKKINRVDKPVEICKNVFLTGEMGDQIKEQSLVINTEAGLVIITGCSHPGIVNILKRAKEIFNRNIFLVLGGFHLLQHSKSDVEDIIKVFKSIGVMKCGATHCTGDTQIKIFKDAFKENYIEMGTGRILSISNKGLEIK